MSRKIGWAALVVCVESLATEGRKETCRRSSADRYAVHQVKGRVWHRVGVRRRNSAERVRFRM